MKSYTTTTSSPSALQLRVNYPEPLVFMYSRQTIQVISEGNSAGSLPVRLTVTHTATGVSHHETRRFHNERVTFDIHRILQLLSPDIDSLLSRAGQNPGMYEDFSFFLIFTDTDGLTYFIMDPDDGITRKYFRALYGALDQGEIFGEHTQRRLWTAFPQTFSLWNNKYDELAFVTDDAYIFPDVSTTDGPVECDFMEALAEAGETDLIRRLRAGVPIRDLGLTWSTRIEQGTSEAQNYRTITLVPDCSRKGTYLRWLNRRGEVSYWLFKNSQLRTTTAVRDTFSRYYEGDPAAPVDDAYINQRKADFREVRELVLGATGLTRDEYEDLCDLAVSPVIERLMSPVPEEDTELNVAYDGGDSTDGADIQIQSSSDDDAVVDGGDSTAGARIEGPYIWQRVTLAAGTYSRDIRRETPNRQDLEFVIELPERNTITL